VEGSSTPFSFSKIHQAGWTAGVSRDGVAAGPDSSAGTGQKWALAHPTGVGDPAWNLQCRGCGSICPKLRRTGRISLRERLPESPPASPIRYSVLISLYPRDQLTAKCQPQSSGLTPKGIPAGVCPRASASVSAPSISGSVVSSENCSPRRNSRSLRR